MRGGISQALSRIYNSEKFPWIIICIGIALRLVRYLHNTSLWFDESVIAVDIINRPLTDFINPSPDYTQTGPLSFYIFTKLAVQLFGNSEYALRLAPLLFGIASLFLFYKAAKEIVSPGAVPVALALFAVLDPLIFYSSELKPYSGDIAFALLILTLALTTFQSKKWDTRHIVILALAGAIAVLSSNPSVFVLGGVGTALSVSCLNKKEWSRLRRILIVCTAWALSFIAVYLVYLSGLTAEMARNMSIEKAFVMEKYFMPFPPKSLMDIKWFIDTFFDTFLFQDSVIYVKRVTLSGIMAFAFLAGCVTMFSEKREKFYFLIFPALLTLLAAAMHQYPFKGRQILFLAPMFLLIISEGAEYIRDKISKSSVIFGAIFMGLLFIYPVSWAAYHLKKPLIRSEIRPALSYIKNNWQEGDIIYVHSFAQYELEYYLKYHPEPFDFNENEYVTGIAPRGWYNVWRKNRLPERYKNLGTTAQSRDDLLKEYTDDLDRLRGRKRVWVLFTGDTTMESFFLSRLDSIGARLDSFGHSGLGVVYLYDLSGQVTASPAS
ncbi:MAG TPA: hypothetical protein ENH01_07760 [Nitrospirae bacterium]|nr:hypothetical protein [Nitrospirota bacterium]